MFDYGNYLKLLKWATKKSDFVTSVLCILQEESYVHNEGFLPLKKKYFFTSGVVKYGPGIGSVLGIQKMELD